MQCIKEAIDEPNAVFPILGYPMIRLEPDFIELPTDLGFKTSIASLPEHAAVRAANRAADERRKKDKDDEEKKWWVKEWVKL